MSKYILGFVLVAFFLFASCNQECESCQVTTMVTNGTLVTTSSGERRDYCDEEIDLIKATEGTIISPSGTTVITVDCR